MMIGAYTLERKNDQTTGEVTWVAEDDWVSFTVITLQSQPISEVDGGLNGI